MATIEKEEIDTWHTLHLRIDDYFTHYDGYVFRGQADSDWRLESSLTRAVRNSYPTAKHEELRQLASQHIANFKADAA
jgi:hypothetical protein